MPEIYLIRHAESTANAGEISQPNPEIELTEQGQAQALSLARSLTLPSENIFVSHFRRTIQTAAPWLERHNRQAITDPYIHEFDPLSYELIAGKTGEERRPLAEAYWEEPQLNKRMGENAETFAEFNARVAHFLDHLNDYPDGSVLFTHGMYIRLVMWHLLGFPMQTDEDLSHFAQFRHIPVPNTAVFRLHWQDSRENAGIKAMPEYQPEHFKEAKDGLS